MHFLFGAIWRFLLHIPMPWQALLVFLVVMPSVPWLLLRGLPWLAAKFSLLFTSSAEFVVQALCFFEFQLSQSIRKRKRNPPQLLYLFSDSLASSVRLAQYLKSNIDKFSEKAHKRPWILRSKAWYTLPLIILPVWFVRPHLGSSSLATLIDNSVSWWCSLEHWAMTSTWEPSRLTCTYPASSSRWGDSLKPKEYEAKRAIRNYSREIENNPDQPDLYYERGNSYLFLEDPESAFDDYSASIEVDYSYAPGYAGRGDIYFLSGDKDAAFKEYSDAVNADSKYADGYVGRGNVYLRMNDHSSAFKEYTAAIEIDSEHIPAYIGRGDVYQKIGDKDAALREYRKAIEIDPDFANAYARVGNLYQKNFEDREAAISAYEKAAELFLINGQISLYNETVDTLENLNKYVTYTVTRGDSLSKIAKRHGVSAEIIIAANRETYPTLATNPDGIEVGWKLKIPQ
jgi:tetratricopeptide (TPR) repeat protein